MDDEITKDQKTETQRKKPNQFEYLGYYYWETLRFIKKTDYYDPDDLFDIKWSALRFIKGIFSNEYQNDKIKECISKMTPFRAKHTVSTYLLGLVIKQKLKIDTRDWRRLPGERTDKGSFFLFWSWVCLFHDVGYTYEFHSQKYLDCQNIDMLAERLKISHSLLSVSSHRDLIKNYYEKRVEVDHIIDHGIAGALLLYDGLMDLAKSEKVYSEIKEYSEFFAKICDAIALHNMWRATPDNIDIYKEYKLYPLIPQTDSNKHIVYMKDDALLFLLGLVDTIDFVKAFRNEERGDTRRTSEVLDYIKLLFTCRSTTTTRMKRICIKKQDDYEFWCFYNSLSKKDGGMESWLGVNISLTNQNPLIEIDTKGSVLS